MEFFVHDFIHWQGIGFKSAGNRTIRQETQCWNISQPARQPPKELTKNEPASISNAHFKFIVSRE